MASDVEATCENDPNFAVICAFLEKFGTQCGLPRADFLELQGMLEDTDEVHPDLVNLFLKLLRRVKKTVKPDKWEKSLVAVCHNFSSQDAWEIERFGYKKAKLTSKVRVLKELLEMQFDYHVKFKNEVNRLTADDLRSKPLGHDKEGHLYWFHSDDNYQIRVYKEDLDEESWTLIAKDREGLVSLIDNLSNGEEKYKVGASNEESKSLENPVIDTGQKESTEQETTEEKDSVSTPSLLKENEKSVKEDTIETAETPKPKLRIKNICELIDTSKKRPRFEDDNEPTEKFLKIKIDQLEMKQTIEKPTMKSNIENSDSPIVGEVIEEKVLYVQGEGNGFDCQTGNEERAKTNEEDKTCNDSQNDSINSVGDFDDSNKKCSQRLGKGITVTEGDSLVSNPSSIDCDQISEKSVSSSLAVDSSKMSQAPAVDVGNIDGIEGSNTCGEGRSRRKSIEDTGEASSPSNSIDENDSSEQKQSGCKQMNDSVKMVLHNNNSTKNDIADGGDSPIHEKESLHSVPVVEKPCVKRVAYTCGTKESHDETVSETPSNSPDDEEKSTKITAERENSGNTDATADKPEGPENLRGSTRTAISVEENDSKSDRFDETPNSNKREECVEEHEKETEVNDVVPKMSLRSVRNKKLTNVSVSQTPQSPTGTSLTEKPGVEKDIVSTEVIYVKGRRCRQKKDREVTPPVGASKKPKLAVTTDKDKEGLTKCSEKIQDTKPGKGVSSPNSVVSSPRSNADSIITFGGSVDSNSLEAPEKDPLAESDQEEVPPKPINLQTFSFDYNDSSTPPPIPVIPSTRLLRKRDREVSPSPKSLPENEGKRRKVKGKRQMDPKLRKSIEQQKEQQVSSSDDDSVIILNEDGETEKPILRPKRKKGAIVRKKDATKNKISDDDSTNKSSPKSKYPVKIKKKSSEIVRHPENKNKRLLAGLDVTEIQLNSVRQSRRLAQIKIKEQAEHKKPETKPKEEKKEKKKEKVTKKSKKDIIVLSSETEQDPDETKKKRKKMKAPNKIFDEFRPWKSSSESSEEDGEEVEDEEEVIEEEPPLEFKSDHEFSPESDLNSADEYQPPKRARTARKKYDEDSKENEKEEEDFPCQKCAKSDNPEVILLCDKCDNGWHCSCLHPPLLSIPEGEWFCPPCQHVLLVENLHTKLLEYDKKLTKKGIEDRRKERLAYVGISLNNVLPSREKEQHKGKRRSSADNRESSSAASESSVSESESSSDDEPIYQLRQRRQARSYKFNEYDELIKSAIQDELNEKQGIAMHHRGKDMATIVEAEIEARNKTEPSKIEEDEPSLAANAENIVETKSEKDISIKQRSKTSLKVRKKGRKMCNLDLSSEEDDEKDEDFKGSSSSSEEDEELEDESEDSDESMLGGRRRNLRPLRRSTRARVSRFGDKFVDDDEEDDIPKKKKKARYSSESDSSEGDSSWGRKKKKGRSDFAKKREYKKKKNRILDELSDLEITKKKKSRIKYGGLTSSDEEMGRGRRTRGKKTTYVDTLGSDSEDAPRKRNSRKLNSDNDDDEDFVAFEDEKDSEEEPEDQLEDDECDEQKKPECSERRALIVPKIYIKKPPVSKDIERNRENNVVSEVKELSNNKQNGNFHENEKVSKDEPTNWKDEQVISKNLPETGKITVEQMKSSLESNSTEKVTTLQRVETAKEQVPLPLKSKRPSNDCDAENLHIETNKNLEKQNSAEKVVKQEQPLQVAPIGTEKVPEKVVQEKETPEIQVIPKIQLKPVMEERKPAIRFSHGNLDHQPIISNVKNMIRNDDSNDELSEPPMGVALPIFEELSSRGIELTRKKKEKGKGKKSLEEAVADLGGKKKSHLDSSRSEKNENCNIEIATPPQPFSQSAPTPSVITRMLQTKPGQTTNYPIGSIRPKQFATMPDDDDESPSSRSRDDSSLVDQPPMNDSSAGQYMLGGSKHSMGASYRPMYINQYPRGILPHQMRPPPSPDIPTRQIHMLPPTTRTSAVSNYLTAPNTTPSPTTYYEGYPSEPVSNEGSISSTVYENSQYSESYENEVDADPPTTTENTSKSYGEESGGEFGGLVSYFSSQHEDDMES
nr:remodeling and spacing factor 1 [Leptinotarsa decemlineata]